jgi:hypothetical protein
VVERLWGADRPSGVIDLDELNLAHPSPGRSFALDNLCAVFPNYAAIPDLRLIIPTVIADGDELVQLRAGGALLAVCELIAPVAVVKERVTAREVNEEWRPGRRPARRSHRPILVGGGSRDRGR